MEYWRKFHWQTLFVLQQGMQNAESMKRWPCVSYNTRVNFTATFHKRWMKVANYVLGVQKSRPLPFLLNSNNFVCVFKAVAQCCALWQKFCCRFSIFARATQLRSTIIRNFQSCQAIIHTLHDRRGDRNCPRSFFAGVNFQCPATCTKRPQ